MLETLDNTFALKREIYNWFYLAAGFVKGVGEMKN